MNDLETEKYKRLVTEATATWVNKVEKLTPELNKVTSRLAALENAPARSAAEDDELDRLRSELIRIRALLEKYCLEFRMDSLSFSAPEKGSKENLEGIKSWFRKLLKKTEIDLGNGATLSPEIKIDLGNFRIEWVGIKIRW